VNEIYKIFSVFKKKILITGAANGNGRAIAKGLGNAGGDLYLVDSDYHNLKIVADEIEKNTNNKVNKFYLDLNDKKKLIKFLNKKFDYDVVINNAGVSRGNHLFNYTDKDWEMTHNINLYAPYKIIQKVSQNMVKKKSGSIINITSLAAELGFPGNPAYVAFKGALKQLTKAATCDLAESGVRINSIGPGYIKTNMTSKSWKNKKLRTTRTLRTSMNRWGTPK
jgi:gluconate 5-dehydrogenase